MASGGGEKHLETIFLPLSRRFSLDEGDDRVYLLEGLEFFQRFPDEKNETCRA